MSCKEVAEKANAMVDGEVSAWEAMQLKVHLAMCKGCGRFVDQIRTTDELTAAAALDDMMSEADDGRINAILAELNQARHQGG
ncbi:zf-HC2 domain-containing protein [Acidimangrovimonas sediminis]|uniref:Zf-HC2 domain-containing protein n=2 Tax=Albidovulum sediminis TaxID=3066345 RepID=A0ABT2NUI4_9RHOB|nr:zf-HC2 domain-containing protein [Defluviimonas sediminis]